MRKQYIHFLIIIIVFIFSFNFSSHAAQLKQGNYLENHQWGALEQIYYDFNTGKISTEECALYGLYILAAQDPNNIYRNEKHKLLPSKYTLNKNSQDAGPYFFVYFLYKNEEQFTQKIRNEFQASEWCEDAYINEIVSNPKVDQAINYFQKSNNHDNDFFSVLLYLADTGVISYESLHITIMIEENNFQKFKKYYLSFIKKFDLKRNKNRTFLLGDLLIKSKKYKLQKAINVLNFHYKFNDLMRKYGYYKNECYKNGFLVYGGSDIENLTYCTLINDYYELICNKNKFNKPINFINKMTLEVCLRHNGADFPALGSAPPIEINDFNGYEAARIYLNLDAIDDYFQKYKISKSKTLIHELIHTIQFSYVDKSKNFYWYNEGYNAKKFNDAFAESTAVWAEDYFYKDNDQYKKYSDAILESAKYFFQNGGTADDNGCNYPGYGFTNCDGYRLGFFWNYFSDIYGNDSIRKLFELLPSKIPLEAISNHCGGNSISDEIFHRFSLNNLLVTKQKGIYLKEDEFILAAEYWKPMPVIQIKENLLNNFIITQGQTLKIDSGKIYAFSSNFLKISPLNGKYFEDSLFIKFDSHNSVKYSVITVWTDVDTNNNPLGNFKYTTENITFNDSSTIFKYYTKKGINPLYFIVVITNLNPSYQSLDPINFEVTLDKPSDNANTPPNELISESGKNYFNDILSLYSKGPINEMIKLDSDICSLYEKYSSSQGADANFYARQIMQKARNLNLLMQTSIVQVHDLMYQFYLVKNKCVDQITSGATSSSIEKQVKNLEKFILAIDLKNQINFANAYVVFNHSDLKLKTTKPIDASEWEMSKQAYDKINLISKTINNYSASNKYEFWYSKNELSEAVSSPYVGIPEDECVGSIIMPPMPPTNGPFGVNYCPAIRKTLDKLKIQTVYTLSSKLKNMSIKVDGATHSISNFLCEKDKCDPLSLKYFSALKKHNYHEQNMPPIPTLSNIKNFVSLLSYYIKLCKNNSLNNTENSINIPHDIIIKGASDRIAEILILIADAVIDEKKSGKNNLADTFKSLATCDLNGREIISLLEKELSKQGYRD